MARKQHIDDILRDWPYEPETVSVRVTRGKDGRDILQMRIDMGILQLETRGRPDGTQPDGAETYYDALLAKALHHGDGFSMSEEQCDGADREFAQFYHRRICWLALRNYRRAVADADHTLGLMDFCRSHSADPQWILSHEQYRPFVLFHRTQAAALAEMEDNGLEEAVAALDDGLKRLRAVFEEHGAEEQFDEDELVTRLKQFRQSLREKYDTGYKLRQQLQDAVAAEEYELAAEIRDKLANLDRGR